MEQLRDELAKFGWTNYEAACYAALVRFGAMKASRVASETDIRKSKVYEPLNRLEEDGFVKVTDDNPKVYSAQNPRYVMELERQQFEQESKQVLEKLQEAWEIQEELGSDDDHAWVVKGRDGASMELSRLFDDAEESIDAFDNRFAHVSRDVIDTLEERAEEIDIRLVSGSQALTRLELLQRAGVDARELTELTRSSYYIVDGDKALMRLSSGDVAVMVEDADIATIISRDFEETFKEASEVSTDD